MPEISLTPNHVKPFIYETLSSKALYFSSHHIQSSMDILQPDQLQFEYTRLMMGFLLFNPHPKRLLMIGLGGGSLAKFCHRYLPYTHVTVVEINPHVIALRRDFSVPDDDERFIIIQDDAAKYVGTTDETFDVVLADGFDISGLPEQLSTRHFFDNCRNVLCPAGVFIGNFHRCNKWFNIYIDRLSAAFDSPVLKVDDPGATNCIAFAAKDNRWQDGRHVGMRRPQQIEEPAWKEILPSIARVFLADRELRRCNRMAQLQPG